MEFPFHQRPNVSRLEIVREEIIAMRSQNWPYHRIATWLHKDKGIAVTKEAIRQFCDVRKIQKGIPRSSTIQNPPGKVSAPPSGKKFHYDDSKPIETRRNR